MKGSYSIWIRTMLVLVSLLAIIHSRINIKRSVFNKIIGRSLLEECSLDGYKTSKHYDVSTTCESFSINSGTFSNIHYDFSLGTGYNGGAIKIGSISKFTLFNNTFQNIFAGNSGGAVYCSSINEIKFNKNSYTDCSSKNGGCLYFVGANTTSISIVEENIINSKSSVDGGTMYFEKTSNAMIQINQSTLITSSGRTGGVIFCNGANSISMNENSFDNCSANDGGVAYFYDITNVASYSSNFSNIKSMTIGGSFHIAFSKKVDFINSNFKNSSLPNEQEERAKTQWGGSIYISSNADVTIDNCIFNISDCINGSGGACYLEKLTEFTLVRSKFIDCRAQDFGGAIHLTGSSSVNMNGNSFIRCIMFNESNTDGRIGGAINLESSTPVTVKRNTFEDCLAYHFGGAISFSTFNRLELVENIFRNCTVRSDRGGAVRMISVEYIDLIKNTFILCTAKQYGGAVYLEKINKVPYVTKFTGDVFEECSSTDYGGAVSLYTVNVLKMDGIKCNRCNSTQGGFLYTYDMQVSIEITNSAFERCSAKTDGGAVCIWYKAKSEVLINGPIKMISFNLSECNFTQCSCSLGNGGAVLLERNVNTIHLKGMNYLSCRANKSGSAFYYIYDYATSKDEVNITSSFNRYENCESGTYGALTIDSRNVDNAIFIGDTYINCKATVLSSGGAIKAKIGDYYSFTFTRCNFEGCSSIINGGALSFETANAKESTLSSLTLSGCSFRSCSSGEGACIKTTHAKPELLTLTIRNKLYTRFTINSLVGSSDKYAISTDASTVKIKQITIEDVEIGALNCSGGYIDINDCVINNCKSTSGIINFPTLSSIKIDGLTFDKCINCFQFKCSSLSNVSSLAIINSEGIGASVIESSTIKLFDMKLLNNKEQITFKSMKTLEISGGSLNNNEELIYIIGEESIDSLFYGHSLSSINSLMFVIEKVGVTKIKECNITYDVQGLTTSKSIITTGSFSNYEISNCIFKTNKITPIELTTVSNNGLLENCYFKGSESAIKVGSLLTVKSCEFSNQDKSFEITGMAGIIKIELDTNCFRNSNFADAISVGRGKVTDLNGNPISEFNNNVCKEITATATEPPVLPTEKPQATTIPHEEEKEVFTSKITKIKITPTFNREKVTIEEIPHATASKEQEKDKPAMTPTPSQEHKEQATATKKIVPPATQEHEPKVPAPSITPAKVPTVLITKPDVQPTPKVEKTEELHTKAIQTPEKAARQTDTPDVTEDNRKMIPTSAQKIDDKIRTIDNDVPEANVANNNKSANTGMLAGVAAGVVVVIILIIIAVIFIARRKKYRHASSSFNELETEFESMENSPSMGPLELKTSYTTQEMPTNSWAGNDVADENADDFLSIGEDSED